MIFRALYIIHVRHEQDGDLFEKATIKSDFISGFEPYKNEHQIIKSNYSCFSSIEFSKLVNSNKSDEFIVIGYSSTLCCLSTIIEGYHKGLKIRYVLDSSMAKANKFDEIDTHNYEVDTISAYADVISTNKLLLG